MGKVSISIRHAASVNKQEKNEASYKKQKEASDKGNTHKQPI